MKDVEGEDDNEGEEAEGAEEAVQDDPVEEKDDEAAQDVSESVEPNQNNGYAPIETIESSNAAVEVEDDHAEDGLEKNALDQQRWSAPPVDAEKVDDTVAVAVTESAS